MANFVHLTCGDGPHLLWKPLNIGLLPTFAPFHFLPILLCHTDKTDKAVHLLGTTGPKCNWDCLACHSRAKDRYYQWVVTGYDISRA